VEHTNENMMVLLAVAMPAISKCPLVTSVTGRETELRRLSETVLEVASVDEI